MARERKEGGTDGREREGRKKEKKKNTAEGEQKLEELEAGWMTESFSIFKGHKEDQRER